MIQGISIVDFHCHFPNSGAMFPDYPEMGKVKFDTHGVRDVHEQWRKAFNFQESDLPKDDKTMAELWIEDMDKKQIERICWVSGGGNERLANIVKMYPNRFIGFAHHHPDSADAAEKLEDAFKNLGMKGYKLLGPDILTSLSDPKYDILWDICGQYYAPVLIHFGLLGAAGGTPNGVNISPMSIADAAKRFPKTIFVCPHFGCTHMQDLLQVMWTRPNVYLDTSGSNQWIRWMPYQLTLEDVIRKFIETVGPGRILFGTDSCFFPRGFATIYLEEQHKIFRFLGLNDAELKLVFHDNAAYLLNL